MLEGTARGETVSKGGGGLVRLSDVDTWELVGFQNQMICRFLLAADVVRGGIWEFENNADGPAFLKRELVGLGVECWSIRVIHKLPDTTPDHVRRQHETAYQLVLKSRQFPGINIR